MRVMLVNPPPQGEIEKHWARFPLLGIAYVAASLRARGHEVQVLDGKLGGLDVPMLIAAVERASPDLVGITCMTVEYPLAAVIASGIRAVSAVPLVIGGAHVNAVRGAALEECAAIDFACIGEGEHLIVELANALERGDDLADIRGLARRLSGRVVCNPARQYHDDYDTLPFPAWDLFRTGDEIPLLTHRGCPFECNFCGHNSGFKPRYRSAENVLDEIAYVVERFRPRTIRFEDETFGLNLARTRRILDGLLQRGLHKQVSFSAQTRVDRVDRDFIRLLKRCSFKWLELGVESGSPGVLERMGKGITLAQVESGVEHAKAEGLRIWCKFILGHPYETRCDMMATANFIRRLNPDRLSVSLMTPYPGTPIFDMAVRGEAGYRLLSSDWSTFDKYSDGVLELEDVCLAELKLLQFYCYLSLYVGNLRLFDLMSLALHNVPLVMELVRGVLTSLRTRRPVPRDSVRRMTADLPIANVASPDATLARLRQRSAPEVAASEVRRARSWADPGR